MDGEDKQNNAAQQQKIRELQEKIRKLEEEKGEAPGGIAANILKELGGVFPGLDGLIKGLGRSEAFRERLEAIDKEVEARLRNQPLKGVEREGRGLSFDSGLSGRPMVRGSPPARKRPPPRAKRDIIASREPAVDVFDEETHLRVLAELPGVEEKDIKVGLNETQLVISADTPTHKYSKETTLPYAPKGQVEKLYRNGILELTLGKE